MDHGGQLHQQVLGEIVHLGPVGDVGAHDQLHAGIGLAEAVVQAVVIHFLVEVILVVNGGIVHVGGGGDASAVGGGGGDGAGVHQAHGGKLALTGLGALAVGEVAGGVPQGQAVVGGHIPGAKAGAAEAGLDDGAGGKQLGGGADLRQVQRYRHRGGIDVQGETVVAGAAAPQDVGCLGDVVKEPAGTARDDALIGPDAAVSDLVREMGVRLGEAAGRLFLHTAQQRFGVIQKFMDGVGIGGMEGQSDHGVHLVKLQTDHPVVVGRLAGVQGLVILGRPWVS